MDVLAVIDVKGWRNGLVAILIHFQGGASGITEGTKCGVYRNFC